MIKQHPYSIYVLIVPIPLSSWYINASASMEISYYTLTYKGKERKHDEKLKNNLKG